MVILNQLLPKSLKQKNGFFVAVTAALVLIALHNPFSGYITTQEVPFLEVLPLSPFCDEGWRVEMGGIEYFCQNGRQVSKMPFVEWRTVHAAFPWLSKVGSMLSVFLAIVTGTVLWILLYREEK
ncbi:hypothetical protein [Methylomonas sp. ZR1]|uniref:hypothetical protein n=1 Tax=Methylomonas sp. ZR1 TaxID=1797072 RepID=UPI001491A7CB|nr:hypothetical protein [Methylomonas sp. ZR1]NOV32584.1 hypothetical protein [Methylomonas sp. ZR1]